VLKIVITFVVAFVVVALLLGVLFTGDARHGLHWTEALSFGLEFGFIASAIAAIAVTIPLNRQLRATADRDLGTIRKFARVVVRGKKESLPEGSESAAARYAALISVILPFTLAYITLLYVGVATQTITNLVRTPNDADPLFGLWFIVALVVILLAIYPLQVVRIRRARRYAREHAELLEAVAAPV
jgi:hypothetical protein